MPSRSRPRGTDNARRLMAMKRGRLVTVCLPARDEEATIGPICSAIRTDLMEAHPIVDELVVVNDGSTDGTARTAIAAGARVVSSAGGAQPAPETAFGDGAGAVSGAGKGWAMWQGLLASEGDVVVYCDADVTNFTSAFVADLIEPLLTGDEIGFVKGCYDRQGGGRVTELVAKPLLRTLFPALAWLRQPLAGECAGLREVLEQVPFVEGYGVDIALVLDVAEGFGVDAICEVDLGRRLHRNRPLEELAPQAEVVLRTVLARAGLATGVPECPPLIEVPGYQRRSA